MNLIVEKTPFNSKNSHVTFRYIMTLNMVLWRQRWYFKRKKSQVIFQIPVDALK